MITDPISDMLTRIRNASLVRKAEVVLPYSKQKYVIAKILKEEGYLEHVEADGEGIRKQLALRLKYEGREPVIQSIQRVSKPGRRVYKKASELGAVRSGYGMMILSTSSGVMTNKEARSRRLGGEVICEIF
ncbi:MAG: 30S ribosomal protein S8 [Parcubacteria group bacterium GW2011_GWA2_56_7]|nr:MAG: 30S ribosomal protein S8 [Parcubacteria group bacterium GW2011_GWA2_56_7]